MANLQPVIKWSGSKRSKAHQIVNKISKNYDTYYEPFCGGCSILYYILNNCSQRFKKYVCSDVNEPLIRLWNNIKNDPYIIIETYKKLWRKLNNNDDQDYKRSVFNDIREQFNQTFDTNLFFFHYENHNKWYAKI